MRLLLWGLATWLAAGVILATLALAAGGRASSLDIGSAAAVAALLGAASARAAGWRASALTSAVIVTSPAFTTIGLDISAPQTTLPLAVIRLVTIPVLLMAAYGVWHGVRRPRLVLAEKPRGLAYHRTLLAAVVVALGAAWQNPALSPLPALLVLPLAGFGLHRLDANLPRFLYPYPRPRPAIRFGGLLTLLAWPAVRSLLLATS